MEKNQVDHLATSELPVYLRPALKSRGMILKDDFYTDRSQDTT